MPISRKHALNKMINKDSLQHMMPDKVNVLSNDNRCILTPEESPAAFAGSLSPGNPFVKCQPRNNGLNEAKSVAEKIWLLLHV